MAKHHGIESALNSFTFLDKISVAFFDFIFHFGITNTVRGKEKKYSFAIIIVAEQYKRSPKEMKIIFYKHGVNQAQSLNSLSFFKIAFH